LESDKLILSDNETKVDMLNNKAIAKTVAEVIRECDDRPISIGVHGDWGAGKSSILAMVEEELESKDGKENGVVCIRFNGWQHQGFEDAKIALMSAIVSELTKNCTFKGKAEEIVKNLWKNINWLSVAKAAGNAVFSISTGLPPIGLLNNLMDGLKSKITDKDKVNAALDSIGKYMTDSKIFEDVSLAKEFSEFQSSFEKLLKESKIKKLVVLIDDLDRCLPKVTIETLEAVRLFMLTESTAFVIAADEAMIEYAVHNHFPNLPDKSNENDDYSKRYLEKLIQVPFKIPALGQVESEMYITLLMISSKIKDNDMEFNALLSATIEKMKRPWENTGLTIEILQNVLSSHYDTVKEEITVSNRISDILSHYTQGNPRKIKRFLNMLLLRKQMAKARGFGESIQIPILAKLMLAEYCFETQYAQIATLADDDGKCTLLAKFEKVLAKSDQTSTEEDESGETPEVKAVSKDMPKAEMPTSDSIFDGWLKDKPFSNWAITQPLLGDIDLRPYFFACKERENYFFEQIKSEQLRDLVSRLMGGAMVVATIKDEVAALTQDDAQKVFDHLIIRIKKTSDFSAQPSGIIGIRALVESHKELETSLVSLIEYFDTKTVGAWICSGWGSSISSDTGKTKLRAYLSTLEKDGNSLVKKAAQAALTALK
jgi:Cdc6-like AAA superfamily ATPase